MRSFRTLRYLCQITVIAFFLATVLPSGVLAAEPSAIASQVNTTSAGSETADSAITWKSVKSDLKNLVENDIKGSEKRKLDIPAGFRKMVDRVKDMLPEKWASKIDEKQDFYLDKENLKRETTIKTTAFVAGKLIGGVCAGVGALIGVASGNPLGVGMGAYVGWRVGTTMGGVVSNYVARAMVDETWDKSDPDYQTAMKRLEWGRITSEGLAATSGSLTGEVLGAYLGAMAGATLGSFTFPIVGTVGGAVVGRWVGKKLFTPVFKFLAAKATNKIYDRVHSPEAQPAAMSETASEVFQTSNQSEIASMEAQFSNLMERYQLLLADSRVNEAKELYQTAIAPLAARIRAARNGSDQNSSQNHGESLK
ncbi:MAG: hypothetical protein CVV64_11650 [Candidatus Wallbacteria bacterium HGW-Wallbacteria-1]|jgi:uncharacterized protein YcfJ|uniref:Glycine zipper domain-containing protein n=1 Tax=Candidatus Wallbacteria bacterium HGW-Wallbacteria-1 TaxID=2013854 RepID=A0A2N1PNQ6_9BACT|nr:MAG: hypothetical protein CVV64_11650 [Candidatus Wallbacteria bacterium HGW-Wallbacteria-1]